MNRSTLESPSATGEKTPACSALLFLLFFEVDDRDEGLVFALVSMKTFANHEAPTANTTIITIPNTIPNRVCFRNVLFECEKSFFFILLFLLLLLRAYTPPWTPAIIPPHRTLASLPLFPPASFFSLFVCCWRDETRSSSQHFR